MAMIFTASTHVNKLRGRRPEEPTAVSGSLLKQAVRMR